MRIEISLNPHSVGEAIKKFEEIRAQIQNEMMRDLLTQSCEWIIQRANYYISLQDIGYVVKQNLQSGWKKPEITNNMAILRNTDDQAVFVEFGVGIIGAENDHKNAQVVNYRYNIGKQIQPDGSWEFYTNSDETIDVPTSFIENISDDGHIITTRGYPAVMYAYNAIIDLKEYGIKEIWENIKRKYWG